MDPRALAQWSSDADNHARLQATNGSILVMTNAAEAPAIEEAATGLNSDDQLRRAGPDSDYAARLRIGLTYLWRHRRFPNLAAPTLFTELVQVRKLCDRDPTMASWADKVTAKSLVANQLGREWVIPMLWSGTALPSQSPVKGAAVVKSRHGCNQNAFIRYGARDWETARSSSAKWMRHQYGWWLDEWAYAQIRRGLLIEPLIGTGYELPLDYKVFVFGGRATHVQVHLDRERNHHWVLHDRNWRALASDAPLIPRPSALSAMLAGAEELATGFDFVRVDFYQPEAQPLFGEMSFYPGSGLDPFASLELDRALGRLWLSAQTDARGHLARQTMSTRNVGIRSPA